jgi:hypothetical protein
LYIQRVDTLIYRVYNGYTVSRIAKTARLSQRITPQLKEKLAAEAARRGLDETAIVTIALEEYFSRQETSDRPMTASKKAFHFSRNSIYVVDPLDLCIVGGAHALPEAERGPLDSEHRKGDHDLYDVRIEEELSEEFVLSIDAFGVQQPVSIAKLEDGRPVVVAGRQRIRSNGELVADRDDRRE